MNDGFMDWLREAVKDGAISPDTEVWKAQDGMVFVNTADPGEQYQLVGTVAQVLATGIY